MSYELHKYIIEKIREGEFKYNIEDFVEIMGLYYKTKKNNKKFSENFKYDIEMNNDKSCIIEEEEYNLIVNTKSLFVFKTNSNYEKSYAIIEGKINADDKELLKGRWESDSKQFNYNEIEQIIIQDEKSKIALRITRSRINELKNKYVLLLGEYILQYKNNNIYVMHIDDIPLLRNHTYKVVKRIGELRICDFDLFNDLCSDSIKTKEMAESRLKSFLEGVGPEFYRVVYLMAKEKYKFLGSIKDNGVESFFKRERVALKYIPEPLFGEGYSRVLLQATALLIFSRNYRKYQIDNKETIKKELSSIRDKYIIALQNFFGEENSMVYVDILNDFTELICDEFSIYGGIMPNYNITEFNQIKDIFKKIKYNLNELEKYLEENYCESYDYFDYEESDNYIE